MVTAYQPKHICINKFIEITTIITVDKTRLENERNHAHIRTAQRRLG